MKKGIADWSQVIVGVDKWQMVSDSCCSLLASTMKSFPQITDDTIKKRYPTKY